MSWLKKGLVFYGTIAVGVLSLLSLMQSPVSIEAQRDLASGGAQQNLERLGIFSRHASCLAGTPSMSHVDDVGEWLRARIGRGVQFSGCSNNMQGNILSAFSRGMSCLKQNAGRGPGVEDVALWLGTVERWGLQVLCQGGLGNGVTGIGQGCYFGLNQIQLALNLDESTLQHTLFHESLHLLGYVHGTSPDYAESCAVCCVPESEARSARRYKRYIVDRGRADPSLTPAIQSMIRQDRELSCQVCRSRRSGSPLTSNEYFDLFKGSVAAFRTTGTHPASTMNSLFPLIRYGLGLGYESTLKRIVEELAQDPIVIDQNRILIGVIVDVLEARGNFGVSDRVKTMGADAWRMYWNEDLALTLGFFAGVNYLKEYNPSTRRQDAANRAMFAAVKQEICRVARTADWSRKKENYKSALFFESRGSGSQLYYSRLGRYLGVNANWMEPHFKTAFEEAESECAPNIFERAFN